MRNSGSKIWKELNTRPLIVAALGGEENLIHSAKKAARIGADLIEIRMDTLPIQKRRDISSLLTSIKQSARLPMIATVRSPSEQEPKRGLFKLDDAERKSIFETVLPQVEVIDVELSSKSFNHPIVQLARRLGKKVILSYHDFHSAPSEKKVRQLVQEFKNLSGDILKIAAMPKNALALKNFLTICADLNEINRVFIAMGKLGAVSRIAGFAFGSCLTYGFVNKTLAPGQISIQELVKFSQLFRR